MRTRLILFLSLVSFLTVNGQDKFKTIVDAVNQGSATELATHFNAQVEIILLGSDEVYTKSQGQMVMKDFFKKNVPSSFSVLHEGNRESSQFFIGTLKTNEGKTFRMTFLLKESGSKLLIHQIRIQQ